LPEAGVEARGAGLPRSFFVRRSGALTVARTADAPR
jgi:hypothetical protein